jgi:protocatechuate 3,4-dioxygenase beta subunit
MEPVCCRSRLNRADMRFHILSMILPVVLAAQQSTNTVPFGRSGGTPQPTERSVQVAEMKPEDRCAIEGQILNATTGEPVKKANLILRRADVAPATGIFPTSYTTVTDAAGNFSMKDIDPGKYRLSVNRTGFVGGEYGARGPMRPGTTLSLDPKQHLPGIVFRLTPHAVIVGRVVDEDREPVVHAQVQTMRYRYNQGKKQLVPFGTGITNDLGEYRIFGQAPGRYFISATYRGGMMMEMMSEDRSGNRQPDEDYAPAYYPGTTDPATAATVNVAAGAQLRGLDFALSKIRTIRIKGRVINATGSGRNQVRLTLMPRDQIGFFNMNRPTISDPNGNFEIRGVSPGAYTLMASIYDSDKSFSARQAIDAGSSNIENVSLTIRVGAELSGSVRLDGQSTVSLSNLRVSLRPRDPNTMMMGSSTSSVKENGTFTISNVAPDHLNFVVSGLPDGFYVKSIRSGDNDVHTAGLDLNRGPAGQIEITLSPGAGQVEGVVRNDKQQPAPGATVVLIPQEVERRDQMSYYKTATSDQYGRFTAKNLDPGEYKVYAWEDMEFGAYMDPELVKPVESFGEAMTLRENGKERLQLKLIPAES